MNDYAEMQKSDRGYRRLCSGEEDEDEQSVAYLSAIVASVVVFPSVVIFPSVGVSTEYIPRSALCPLELYSTLCTIYVLFLRFFPF